MTTIILKPKKEESLLRQHPWVFSGAIERVVLDKDYPFDAPQEGEVVGVKSHDGKTLGVGHYQIGSITVRMLAFGVDTLPKDFYKERISAAYLLRQTLGLTMVHGKSSNGTSNNTFRLVHGEGDNLPGLVIDIYANTAVIQAHSVGMHIARNEIAQAVKQVVKEVENIYYKSDDTLPFKANIPTEEKTGYIIQNSELKIQNSKFLIEEFWSTENGLDFRIDWLCGQKTGFFVDQRDNRALVEKFAKGKKVLNMFCYTGGFSVYALRGGAQQVDSVDVSEKAVELVRKNVERNFPACTNHNAYAEEAFAYMADIKDKYDLIILDPPAFAKHRDAIKNALRGYQRLNQKAIEQIKKGGILFTFSCSQAIDKEMFRLAVFSAAAAAGRKVRILYQLHQPADHPINIYHPEGEYLKGLVLYIE